MPESQPLIKKLVGRSSSEKSSSLPNVSKKLAYSNWLSTVFYAGVLGTVVYFAYPYITGNGAIKGGHLSPARVAAVSTVNGYSSDAQSDLVTYLPNLDGEQEFNTFTGYLDATNGRQIFYWFEESQSDTASTDPLIFWTNGGPGCSGLVGLLTEHGGYWVYDDLSLKANPYSWNKLANMIYIEQPYGVGFSVINDDDSVVTGDDNAVTDIDAIIRSFLTKYPKYASNEVIVSAESYGGHYVPLTAKKVLENNAKGVTPSVNLMGMLVGNPLSSYGTNEDGFIVALYGHGLIKKSLYDDWISTCYGNEEAIAYSTACEILYVKAYIASYDADVYALDFPTCTLDDDDLAKRRSKREFLTERKIFHDRARERAAHLMENEAILKEHFGGNMEMVIDFQSQVSDAVESTTVPYISCNTYDLVDYLNLDSVQTALHVKSMSSDWDYCNDAIFNSWPDSDWLTSMKDTYLTLVNDYDIKMLIYSGDDDSVCSTQGTMAFLATLGLNIDSSNDWNEWTYDDQLAGFYTKYLDKDGNSALHFQTVRSAGHMVPTTQPERALELLNRFLNYYE